LGDALVLEVIVAIPASEPFAVFGILNDAAYDVAVRALDRCHANATAAHFILFGPSKAYDLGIGRSLALFSDPDLAGYPFF
jgi:hypothetical protein